VAIWHARFSLVPSEGIVAVHGEMPRYLREYQPPTEGSVIDVLEENSPGYWKRAGMSPSSIPGISKLLPACRSWSSEAEMYGSKDGDRVEIWKDEVHCAMDMRVFSAGLLENILTAAKQAECKIVMHGTGEVLDADITVVTRKIKESGAYEFCADPEQYFRNRRGN
jgi:hypothetical protein